MQQGELRGLGSKNDSGGSIEYRPNAAGWYEFTFQCLDRCIVQFGRSWSSHGSGQGIFSFVFNPHQCELQNHEIDRRYGWDRTIVSADLTIVV